MEQVGKHSKKRKKSAYNKVLTVLIFVMLGAQVFCVYKIDQIYVARVRENMHIASVAFTSCIGSVTEDASENSADALEEFETVIEDNTWKGPVLSKGRGVNNGPSGKETYYNLNMSVVVRTMRNLGYDYEYWVRDDGVKMLGDYVMIAANLNIRPKGTIVMTSLGPGIVCDTGGFAKKNTTQIDIATTW